MTHATVLYRVVPNLSSRLSAVLLTGLLAMMGVLSGSQALAEGDAAAGAQKAHTCLGCHGVKHYVNIYPTYHVPKLAGQHEAYLISALKAYRNKTRAHGSMQANAALLTDQDIADISKYFAESGGEAMEPAKKEVGLEIAGTCASCHAADGNSELDTNPRIAGQYKSYLLQALKSYKDGSRENAIMGGMVAALSEADMKALADYFASHKGSLRTAKR